MSACSTTDDPEISVVVVTYKSADYIRRCLEPIAGRSGIQIVVWENASGDSTPDIVRDNFTGVELHRSEQNLGFSRGNNAAFAFARGDYVLLLNPDAFLPDAETVYRMCEWLCSNPDYAACGPQLLHETGEHQVGDAGWRISPVSVAAHSLFLQWFAPQVPSLYLSSKRLLASDQVDVDWICGACMMVKRSVIEDVGGLDDQTFMYGEDIEWGTRMRDVGWRIAYLPKLKVVHLQGASQKARGEMFQSKKWLDDIFERFQPHATKLGLLAMGSSLAIGFMVRAMIQWGLAVLKRQPSRYEAGTIAMSYAKHGWLASRQAARQIK